MPNFRGAGDLFRNLLYYQIENKQKQVEEKNRLAEEERRNARQDERDATQWDQKVFLEETKNANKNRSAILLENMRHANDMDKLKNEATTDAEQNAMYTGYLNKRAKDAGVNITIPIGANRSTLERIDQDLDLAIGQKNKPNNPYFLPSSVFDEVDNTLVRRYSVFIPELTIDNYTPENVYSALPPDLQQQWDNDRQQMISISSQTGTIAPPQSPVAMEPDTMGPEAPGQPPVGSMPVGREKGTGKIVYKTRDGSYWRAP